MGKDNRFFTLLELLLTLVILGVALSPFFRIIWYGKKSSLNIKDEVVAQLLVREKIEELKLLSFSKISSDFVKFGRIYRGTRHEEFIDMDSNEELFNNKFTDVYTSSLVKKYPLIFNNFKKVYRDYFGLPYQVYPDNYKKFRRITRVEEKKDYQKSGIKVKIIEIAVYYRDTGKKILSHTFIRVDDGR